MNNPAQTIVTEDNIDTLVYDARPGVVYEFTPECKRVLKRPFIETERAFTDIMAMENVAEMDPNSAAYWVNTRMTALYIITEGDDLPQEGWTTDMLSRVVSDFFRYRYTRPAPQKL